jgi:glycosyltransferase involved in cell wall biosynthesis
VSDRPHVLLVVAEVAGGIAAHVRALACDLSSLDVDVTVMAPASSLELLRLEPSGVEVVAAPVGSLTPRAAWEVRRQLRRAIGPSTVVHAQGLRAGATPGVPRGVPLVATWHNTPLGNAAWRRAYAAVERRVARRATVVLAASTDLLARARAAGSADARLVLVGSPVPATPSPSRDQVRAELGIGPDLPIVLAVGRLQRQKRLDVLVAAAAGWPATGAGARRVVVAGDGPARDALQAQIDETGAPVTLLGARDDVAELMAAADVVVLTSEWEARSLVAQEALRAGVPLVCSAVGGLPDLVADAAVLVPVGDSLAVRVAVDRVLSDPELLTALVERGRRLAVTWPTDLQVANEHRNLYLDLLSRSHLSQS